MKLEAFHAGHWRNRDHYKSFEPALINHAWTWDDAAINTLLEDAVRALGELNASSLIIPDVDLFIQMHVVKEAQSSSRIEGTQTSIDEVLRSEEHVAPERRDDWREVRNYIDAINDAITALDSLPLSNRLLRQAHATLLRGVRGVAETASKGCRVFREILQLNEEVEQKIRNLGRRTPLAHRALQVFYRRPVLTAEELQNALQITRDSSYRVIKTLAEEGVIESNGSDRYRRYSFEAYLKLFFV